jgi:signal peptidase I
MENLSYASSPYTSSQTRKGMAAASLVIGVINILTLGLFLIGALAGLILGLVALRRSQREPALYGGAGYAIAGITTSAVSLVLMLAAVMLIAAYFIKPIRVAGQGMMPTLREGEQFVLWKGVGSINRGDIVAFLYPDDPSKSYIKRVIGMPGEEVMIENGRVLINGSPLDEPYLNEEYRSADTMPAPIHVKDHHYFVLGDNRPKSSDSRYWGTVPEKYIYGKIEKD